MSKLLTLGKVRELFDYNARNGELRWRVKPCKRMAAGVIAGHKKKEKGYRRVLIDGRLYQLHSVVWFWVYGEWPVGQIDHVNHITDDNRIENLRLADRTQQNANRQNTRPGRLKGAYFREWGRWQSKIVVRGRKIYLGTFDTEEEAHEAYGRAAREHFGEYACLG